MIAADDRATGERPITADNDPSLDYALKGENDMNAKRQRVGNGQWYGRLGTSLLALAIAMIVGAFPSTADAASVTVTVEGLPSGLTVGVAGGFMQCPPNGTPFLATVGSALLVEETFTVFERVTLRTGQVTFKSRLVSTGRYSGEISVTPPASNGCPAVIPVDTFGYFYSVAGEDANGTPHLRATRTFFPGPLAGQAALQFNDVLKAETLSIVEAGSAPTTLSKGQFHTLTVRHSDIFGPDAIVTPSLEFTQRLTFGAVPGSPSGPGIPCAPQLPGFPGFKGFPGISVNLSVLKMTLTGGQVCLRVGSTTQCKARSAGGNLAVGAVTVNVGQTTDTVVNNERVVNWVFRLEPAFGAGNLLITAVADDADLFSYTVDGVQQPLNLLPWKPLQLSVSVPN
jgi:hypothetical protein